jgi:phospholipid/cholesterol/gamma-HCH transport system substrate-binding protein
MKHRLFETILGAIIIASAFFVVIYAYQTTQNTVKDSYLLYAKFQSTDGIIEGADVKIGGVKIGRVKDLYIEQGSFLSVLKLQINNEIKLPAGAQVSIASAGLLGKAFVDISPELADDKKAILKDGDNLINTRSATSLEDLLGRAIFLLNDADQ